MTAFSLIAQQPVIPNFGEGSKCETENHAFCTSWVADHWSDTLQPALLQHIKLAVIAVAIGFVLAFAAALVAYRYRRADQPIGLLSDFLYTIPSLALFQLLVPLSGLTVTTVEIALVSYTLLILYRNILEGLRGVPAEVREAARGMGLTRLQSLFRVELPLAVPSIMAGAADRDRVDDLDRHHRRVRDPGRVGPADLHRDRAGRLQDGDHRRGRPHDPPRAGRRRSSRPPGPRADPMEKRVIRLLADSFSWGTFPDAIRFIGDNPGLLWHKSVQHMELSGAAIGIALLLALPLGVVLGHLRRGSFVAISVSNLGRALPSLVLIAFALFVSGHFFVNNMAALIVLGVPPILTNAYFGIEGVDRNIVEAARGMGMSGRDILFRIELPLALPLIIAGIRIAAVFIIATATIAAVAGGGGLGDVIVNQATYQLSGVVGASLVVSLLAFGVALILGLVRKLLTRPYVSAD